MPGITSPVMDRSPTKQEPLASIEVKDLMIQFFQLAARTELIQPGFEAYESGPNPERCSGNNSPAVRYFDPIGCLPALVRDLECPQRKRG